jgi:hypothetical protein
VPSSWLAGNASGIIISGKAANLSPARYLQDYFQDLEENSYRSSTTGFENDYVWTVDVIVIFLKYLFCREL